MKIATTPKEKLYQTAARLFFQHGYRAVGVDTIAAESGVGKMTLYRHYPSKDDLIVAFLRQSDEDFWEYFEQSIAGASGAREKLLAFFQGLQDYVLSPACYGCPFINVASEYPEATYAGHQVALEHKQAVRARFNCAGAGSRCAPARGVGECPAPADGRRLYGGAHVWGCPRQSGQRCSGGGAATDRRALCWQ